MTSSVLMLIDAVKRSFALSQVTPSFQPTLLAASCVRETELCSALTASVIKQAQSAATQHGWRLHDYLFSEAHAYMLISSPTATSMILGAFQAMLSSLV